MRKSPEEYFNEQDFSVPVPEPGDFTPAELAFMEKYMGVESPRLLEQLGLQGPSASPGKMEAQSLENKASEAAAPVEQALAEPSPLPEQEAVEAAPAPAPQEEDLVASPVAVQASEPEAVPAAVAEKEEPVSLPAPEAEQATEVPAAQAQEADLEEALRNEAEIQMVGFFIGGQEFTIPTMAVQEVIRAMPVAKLPAAPSYVAGVINLRGRVTPLVELREILEVRSAREGDDKFIIVCRRQGLQIGMIIEKVHTMYRVPQKDIEWGIEARIGINADYIAGLFKQHERLVSIVSVDRVVAGILK